MGIVSFSPKQDGTGDPSPTNIRPIHPGLTIDGIGDIYGGYVDFENGGLVKEYENIDLSTIEWDTTTRNDRARSNAIANVVEIPINGSAIPNLLCEKYKAINSNASLTNNQTRIAILSDGIIIFYYNGQTLPSGCMAYKLATPIIYSLTASQLTQAYNQLVPVSSVMLARRRRMIASNGLLLPPEYELCDYLQTVGNASHINTGIAGNDNSIQIDFVIEVLALGNYSGILGNWDTESKKCWRFIQGPSTDYRQFNFTLNSRRAGASPGRVIPTIDSRLNKIVGVHMEYNYGWLEYDNVKYDVTGTITTEELSTYNIFIGKTGLNAGSSANGPSYKFHKYVRIKKQGILMRDYRPCIRKSDNKAGFYDMVNHTFNPSIGSQDFIAGND